ncbi:unnamed protein product [Alopecurus aequalis]
MEDRSKKLQTDPPASLPGDLIVEILSCLPVRLVHRCRCVAKSWRDLICHPDHRKKLPQTLAGFFYGSFHSDRLPRIARHFANVSAAGPHLAVDPSLPFLPKYSKVDQLDTCNGLLLCRCYKNHSEDEFDYIVCNPVTERWVELPPYPMPKETDCISIARLAFNPAASSHFHVFQFEETDQEMHITGVNIYSSQTGAWNHRESEWDEHTMLPVGIGSVFVNGILHLITAENALVTVDTEGKSWSTIHVPGTPYLGFIGLSRGCLHYVSKTSDSMVSVLCLEDYQSKEWVLKLTVSTEELSGGTGQAYSMIAIHPYSDIIFLVSSDTATLASYDIRRHEFRRICNLEEGFTGPYLPYVPLFSESAADED